MDGSDRADASESYIDTYTHADAHYTAWMRRKIRIGDALVQSAEG